MFLCFSIGFDHQCVCIDTGLGEVNQKGTPAGKGEGVRMCGHHLWMAPYKPDIFNSFKSIYDKKLTSFL